MKKIFSFMLAFCLVLPCALMLTACGEGFETGKKYTLSKIEFVWASEEEKTTILGGKTEEDLKSTYDTKAYLTFNDDGTVSGGIPATNGSTETTLSYYYTKSGNTITLFSDEAKEKQVAELEVSGNSLIQTQKPSSQYETTVKLTYTK